MTLLDRSKGSTFNPTFGKTDFESWSCVAVDSDRGEEESLFSGQEGWAVSHHVCSTVDLHISVPDNPSR